MTIPNIIEVPCELKQCIFSFLGVDDLLLIRSTCKHFGYGSHNKKYWKDQFEFFKLLDYNYKKCGGTKLGNEYVTQLQIDHRSISEDFVRDLHVVYPNLVYVSFRYCNFLPDDTLDYLSKLKHLMFLDVYDTNLTNKLICQEVKKFLATCPNLIELDLATICGLVFSVLIDGAEVDFLGEDYQRVLDNEISIESVETQPSKKHWCSESISARDYPHIRSWDCCRFDVNKIKSYRILSNVGKCF